MNRRAKYNNYLHLGIQSTFFLLAVKYITSTLHELGHGVASWLVGLKFYGYYLAVFGGGQGFVAEPGNDFQQLLLSSGGPVVDLVFGLIVLFVVLPRIKRWGAKIFLLYYAVMTLSVFWAYMVLGGFLGGGDFANIARVLGINLYAVGVFGFLGLMGFGALIVRKILTNLSSYFPMNSYMKRFPILLLFLGVPGIVYAGVGNLIHPFGDLSQFLFLSLLSIIVTGLLSLVRHRGEPSLQSLPKWPSLIGLLIFGGVCIIWLGVFGLPQTKARGVLWNTPEDDKVGVANISIQINKELNAHIDYSMRSHSHHLLWEKMKYQTPNWSVFRDFIGAHVPTLLGVSDYEVIEKANDLDAPFSYFGLDDVGARKVSLVVDLNGRMDEAEENMYTMEINSWWRFEKCYICKLEIILEDGLRFLDYELIPENARDPAVYNEKCIVWENISDNAPERVRLGIHRSFDD